MAHLRQMSAELTAQPDLLTVRETAARLGLGRSTVYQLIAKRELLTVHPTPASVRVTARSIEQYLARIGA